MHYDVDVAVQGRTVVPKDDMRGTEPSLRKYGCTWYCKETRKGDTLEIGGASKKAGEQLAHPLEREKEGCVKIFYCNSMQTQAAKCGLEGSKRHSISRST